MMGYRNPDSGLGASVVVTVGFGRHFQLTGTRAGPGKFNGASFPRYISVVTYNSCFNIG
jgi:hypothetical protein